MLSRKFLYVSQSKRHSLLQNHYICVFFLFLPYPMIYRTSKDFMFLYCLIDIYWFAMMFSECQRFIGPPSDTCRVTQHPDCDRTIPPTRRVLWLCWTFLQNYRNMCIQETGKTSNSVINMWRKQTLLWVHA